MRIPQARITAPVHACLSRLLTLSGCFLKRARIVQRGSTYLRFSGSRMYQFLFSSETGYREMDVGAATSELLDFFQTHNATHLLRQPPTQPRAPQSTG
jgi:hypothetical protein